MKPLDTAMSTQSRGQRCLVLPQVMEIYDFRVSTRSFYRSSSVGLTTR